MIYLVTYQSRFALSFFSFFFGEVWTAYNAKTVQDMKEITADLRSEHLITPYSEKKNVLMERPFKWAWPRRRLFCTHEKSVLSPPMPASFMYLLANAHCLIQICFVHLCKCTSKILNWLNSFEVQYTNRCSFLWKICILETHHDTSLETILHLRLLPSIFMRLFEVWSSTLHFVFNVQHRISEVHSLQLATVRHWITKLRTWKIWLVYM